MPRNVSKLQNYISKDMDKICIKSLNKVFQVILKVFYQMCSKGVSFLGRAIFTKQSIGLVQMSIF